MLMMLSAGGTAEGALDEIINASAYAELAVQSGTGTTSTADRTYMNSEFVALREEIDRIADNTQWNGQNILDGSAGASTGKSTVAFQVGAMKNRQSPQPSETSTTLLASSRD